VGLEVWRRVLVKGREGWGIAEELDVGGEE